MLKNHADSLSYAVDIDRTVGNAVSLELNISTLDILQLVDAAQQCRLARTGRPDQHRHAALLHIKLHSLEHFQTLETLMQINHRNQRIDFRIERTTRHAVALGF